MVYGTRGYGARGYGDSSLGGADLGGGGAPVVTLPASVSFAASTSIAFVAHLGLTASVSFSAAASFAALSRVTLPARVSFGAEVSFAPILRIVGKGYRIVVVDQAGTRYGELENATLGPMSWVLNGVGAFEFAMDTLDPKALLAQPIAREVQVWYGNRLIWAGPIVKPQAGMEVTGFQCATPFWYFTKRNFGKADRDDLLENGSFEEGLAYWNMNQPADLFGLFVNPGASTAFFAEVTSERAVDQGHSVRLEASPDGHMNSLTQSLSRVASWVLGDNIFLVGWSWVPSGLYLGPNLGDDALGLTITDGVETLLHESTAWDPEAVDVWVRHEVMVHQPQGTYDLIASISPPHGVAYWDLVHMNLMESLAEGEADASSVYMAAIANYAQDRILAFDHGKSDLNIDVDCPPSGIMVSKVYQHVDAANLGGSIQEFVSLGIDFDVIVTPTSRTFRSYPGGKGTVRDLVLELGRNIAAFAPWSFDGEQAANQVRIQAPGTDGPGREEGGYTDASEFGGVTLEFVDSAPDGSSVTILDDLARQKHALVKNPVILEVVTYEGAGDLIGVLQTGDIHPVRIDWGYVQVGIDAVAYYRIVQITLDPATDQMTLVLNRA